jgi:hypothetical protein
MTTDYRTKCIPTLTYYIDRWNKIFPQEAVYNFKKLKKAELVDACEKIDFTRYNTEKDVRYFSFSYDETLQFLFDGNEAELKKYKIDKLRDRSQFPSNYRVLGFYENLECETDGRRKGCFFLDKSLTFKKIIYWTDGDANIRVDVASYLLGNNKDYNLWCI